MKHLLIDENKFIGGPALYDAYVKEFSAKLYAYMRTDYFKED